MEETTEQKYIINTTNFNITYKRKYLNIENNLRNILIQQNVHFGVDFAFFKVSAFFINYLKTYLFIFLIFFIKIYIFFQSKTCSVVQSRKKYTHIFKNIINNSN